MRTITDILLYGPFDLSLGWYIGCTLLMTHITIMTVTIYYHRAGTHKALKLHPKLELFFRYVGWTTTGMVLREWKAVHLKHHARADKEGDPHSPQREGILNILLRGVWYYYNAARDKKTIHKYGEGTPRDWLETHVFNSGRKDMFIPFGKGEIKIPLPFKRRFMGVVLMLLIDLMLFGLVGLVIWVIQMLWIPFWAAGVINGLGHYPLFRNSRLLFYRNTPTKDSSTNIIPWGIGIGGEELHNNHHACLSSAKLSRKWYEFDIGWMYILIFKWLGLAWNIRTYKT